MPIDITGIEGPLVAQFELERPGLAQRVAVCFAAGVIGALAVILFSQLLFALGVSQALGVKAPVSLKSPTTSFTSGPNANIFRK